jgi:hypothetical protein
VSRTANTQVLRSVRSLSASDRSNAVITMPPS